MHYTQILSEILESYGFVWPKRPLWPREVSYPGGKIDAKKLDAFEAATKKAQANPQVPYENEYHQAHAAMERETPELIRAQKTADVNRRARKKMRGLMNPTPGLFRWEQNADIKAPRWAKRYKAAQEARRKQILTIGDSEYPAHRSLISRKPEDILPERLYPTDKRVRGEHVGSIEDWIMPYETMKTLPVNDVVHPGIRIKKDR